MGKEISYLIFLAWNIMQNKSGVKLMFEVILRPNALKCNTDYHFICVPDRKCRFVNVLLITLGGRAQDYVLDIRYL